MVIDTHTKTEPTALVIDLAEYKRTGYLPPDPLNQQIEQYFLELDHLCQELTQTKPKPKTAIQYEIEAIEVLQKDIEDYRESITNHINRLQELSVSTSAWTARITWKMLRSAMIDLNNCYKTIEYKKNNIKRLAMGAN